MTTTYTSHALTDQGIKRKNNEDCYIVEQSHPEAGLIFAVADGMGGHAAGETASRLACHQLHKHYFAGFKELTPEEQNEEKLFFLLETIVYNIHVKLIELSTNNINLQGMGTTMSALVIRENRGLIIHVGDSRIYRLRSGTFEQLTRDHTELQQYIDNGQLTKEEAAQHHLRHILSQAIGGKSNSFRRAFTLGIDIEPGDLFLLCSDGLYDMTGNEAIEDILKQGYTLQKSADLLLNKALDCGGKDNISVVLVQADS